MGDAREYTIELAAHALRMPKSDLARLIRRGEIKAHRHHGNSFIYEIELVRYIQRINGKPVT